jgi:hypothetical protein
MLKWQGVTYIISVQLTFHTAAVTMIVKFPTDMLYVYMYVYVICDIYICVCVCVRARSRACMCKHTVHFSSTSNHFKVNDLVVYVSFYAA